MNIVQQHHPTWGIYAYLCALLTAWAVLPAQVLAQQSAGSFTFTVTPPLIQLALQPGETWSSTIQVVNQNPYEVTIFAEPVLFAPGGESGRPIFTRTMAGSDEPISHDHSVIAGWITVPTEPTVVAREQTLALPIQITVPHDAAPGGHYAAVLIGNTPPTARDGGNTISVTSSIASLIFLRVAGDVREEGRIREFSTERMLYDTAEAVFSLRFENKGNVHLQPQGGITIYNMFGKERGKILVNRDAGYGNVLPESVREFSFRWESDTGLWDIGRYRAVASLGYGEERKSFADATVYFWVLPIVPFLEIVGALVLIGWFFAWSIRAYIRRALALEAHVTEIDQVHVVAPDVSAPKAPEPQLTVRALVRPITAGMVDLRKGGQVAEPVSTASEGTGEQAQTSLVWKYRGLLIFIVLCIVLFIGVRAYVRDVSVDERAYTTEAIKDEGTTVESRE